MFWCRFVEQNLEKSCFRNSTPFSSIKVLLEVQAAESEFGRAKWGVKWRPTGQVRGSGSKSFADRFCLAVGAMETIATQRKPAANQVGSEAKVYLTDKSYD